MSTTPVDARDPQALDGAQQFAFIVRLWWEPLENDGRARIWRGSVEQVGCPPRLYFHDWESLVQFLAEHAGTSPPKRRSWWRKFWSFLTHAQD